MKPESFRDLMRLVHGFESAKILLVANDLDLFRHLHGGRTVSSLAQELGVNSRALELLMNALVALGLLEKGEAGFQCAPVAANYLGNDGYRGHIFRHIHHCWESWNDLAGVLRRGGPEQAREAAILHEQENWNRDFIRGMDDVTLDLAPLVVSQIELEGARRLLDIGGGPGTYARAFLDVHPHLAEVTIFDLPQALVVAEERCANYPRRNDVRLVAGDFHRDAFGGNYDAIWISQVLHSQDEAGCAALLGKAVESLNAGGVLMVHEFLLDESRTQPLTAALFAVHMLVMTAGGRAYSGKELAGWMQERGLETIEVRKVSEDTGIVIGRMPG